MHENETNTRRLYNHDNGSQFFKDGINDRIVHDNKDAINPLLNGTKSAAHYPIKVGPDS